MSTASIGPAAIGTPFDSSPGSSAVSQLLLKSKGDPGILRPYVAADGQVYYTKNNANGKPETVRNNTLAAPLRYDDWKAFDEAIIRAAKPRLMAFGDLRSSGLTYSIPNGMAKTQLQYERQSDITQATVSMSALRRSQEDRPVYDLQLMPLPIIHKDFSFDLRQILASRESSTPLDTTSAELAGRRVAEVAEELTLGTYPTYTYGGGSIYGYTNFPQRLTYQPQYDPTSGSWTPLQTVQDVLAMRLQSQQSYHYGPWNLYCSLPWDTYLDEDYKNASSSAMVTLRERLARIKGINKVETLDYLTGYQMVLVQQTADVARAVVGMDITTVQWETNGGLELHFKVMAILLPQLRTDIYGNTGIVHAASNLTTSPASAPTQAQIYAE